MAVPKFDVYFLPTLEALNKKPELALKDLRAATSAKFNLTDEDLKERVGIGFKIKHYDRLNWALTYMKKAGLVHSVARGVFAISPDGKKVLKEGRTSLGVKDLYKYPSFVEFQSLKGTRTKARKEKETPDVQQESSEDQSPTDRLKKNYRQINQFLASDILEKVKQQTPVFFEQLVVHLLERMGYGGEFENKGKVSGGPGDGGIDAIINQDTLGLEKIYVQAKRWEQPVTASDLRDFVGALNLRGASKGVFFTTSTFSKQESDNISRSAQNIILIDGEQLAQLMIKYKLGVSVEETISLCRLDSDYFED